MVIMNAATSIITTKSPYVARVSVTLPQMHDTFGTWAARSGTHKLYSMVLDLGPGHDAEQAFQRAYKEAGGEIVGSVRYPVANPDFSAFVQRAKDFNPEAIYLWVPGGAQPAALGKALADRGIDPKSKKILGNDVLTDDSALASMGDIAQGIITVSYYDHNLNTARNKDFVKAYQAEFRRNPDIFSIGGWDGMHLIYEALKATGGKTDADSLIGAAKGMRWESPRGPMSIDPETRDVVQTVYIRRVEKVSGKPVNVEFEKVEDVKDPVKARMKN
jgi:branched-chain amino acid transport system substrate-binding protein